MNRTTTCMCNIHSYATPSRGPHALPVLFRWQQYKTVQAMLLLAGSQTLACEVLLHVLWRHSPAGINILLHTLDLHDCILETIALITLSHWCGTALQTGKGTPWAVFLAFLLALIIYPISRAIPNSLCSPPGLGAPPHLIWLGPITPSGIIMITILVTLLPS